MVHHISVVVLFSSLIWSCAYGDDYYLTVNSSVVTSHFNQFWRSTGFCPPLPHQDAYKFDLGSDMRQNLAFIGAIPQTGIQQVRIHWLFDLITIDSFQKDGTPVYNYTYLDSLLDLLYDEGLAPGFEIMGNPSNFFTDFENKTQVYLWRNLVYDLVSKYVDEYGLGVVMGWNFETWNEPDCQDFDGLKMTPQGFLNYYDACLDALMAINPSLKLGGPGDGCHFAEYSEAFLDHVVNGKNILSGQKVKVDFLSYHLKGDMSSRAVFDSESNLMKNITEKYPSLEAVPFYNDEADPLVGWSKDEEWRADATYAAMVTKVIGQHLNEMVTSSSPPIKNYKLLSNDNGFLSWYPYQFTERTLLARFQINTTQPPHTQFIRKPGYDVMGLLSLMGNKQIATNLTTVDGTSVSNFSNIGVMAAIHTPDVPPYTSDSWHLSVIIYNSDDTKSSNQSDMVSVTLDVQPGNHSSGLMLVVYAINNKIGNPYSIWTSFGKPKYPSLPQLQEMRNNEGPVRVAMYKIKPGVFRLPNVEILQPGIVMLHVCDKPKYEPDQVNDVSAINITSGQILITWSDHCVNSRCILTYEVEYSNSASGPFLRINKIDTAVTAFVYSPNPSPDIKGDDLVIGFYRVRAVDYWHRAGEYSLQYQYPSDSQAHSDKRCRK
ncbi:hypothetical protein ACJMK2_005507 [Sinanodonta woodiana]|uniref:Alpha-L-iduronidase n=1 Tax=Sinanodonta woodiana TaxID=1069815 RepID=A0ABD3VQM2_SINWO